MYNFSKKKTENYFETIGDQRETMLNIYSPSKNPSPNTILLIMTVTSPFQSRFCQK
jgi:hypothetical protein